MERLKFHRRESWGKILNSQNLYDWGCFWTATTWQKGGSTQGVYPMYLPILLLFTHPILLAAITVRTSTGGLLVCSMAATFLLFKQFPIQTAKTASIASSFSRSDLRAQIGEKIHLGKEHTPCPQHCLNGLTPHGSSAFTCGQRVNHLLSEPCTEMGKYNVTIFATSYGSEISDWRTQNPVPGWQILPLFSLHKLLWFYLHYVVVTHHGRFLHSWTT